MTIPTRPMGGAACPIKQVSSTTRMGTVAIPVYLYATQPTDGRAVMGGSALPVVILSASDLKQNGGNYTLVGMPEAMPVMIAPTGTAVLGQDPIPVYIVNP